MQETTDVLQAYSIGPISTTAKLKLNWWKERHPFLQASGVGRSRKYEVEWEMSYLVSVFWFFQWLDTVSSATWKTSTTVLPYPFNGLFSRTTCVSRHQKGKPFWILLVPEMMRCHWHQLDHMQIICSLLQADNHASTSPLKFLQARCPSCRPTNSIKALKATTGKTSSL